MEIKVTPRETGMGWRFVVSLIDAEGEKQFHVSMDRDFLLRVGSQFPPEKIVKKSFEFLLERESKDQIQEEFDIGIISHYYPEYINELLKKMDFS